jgi:hypothetical protein
VRRTFATSLSPHRRAAAALEHDVLDVLERLNSPSVLTRNSVEPSSIMPGRGVLVLGHEAPAERRDVEAERGQRLLVDRRRGSPPRRRRAP